MKWYAATSLDSLFSFNSGYANSYFWFIVLLHYLFSFLC